MPLRCRGCSSPRAPRTRVAGAAALQNPGASRLAALPRPRVRGAACTGRSGAARWRGTARRRALHGAWHGMAWCRAMHGMGHGAWHGAWHGARCMARHAAQPRARRGARCWALHSAVWSHASHRKGCAVQRIPSACLRPFAPPAVPVCLSEPSVRPVEGCLLVTVWCWYFVLEWVLLLCVRVRVCRPGELCAVRYLCEGRARERSRCFRSERLWWRIQASSVGYRIH